MTVCNSTHGASGYAPGSYWDGAVIVCGACGTRIEDPRPTGSRSDPVPGWRGWLLRRTVQTRTWPAFIGGNRGVSVLNIHRATVPVMVNGVAPFPDGITYFNTRRYLDLRVLVAGTPEALEELIIADIQTRAPEDTRSLQVWPDNGPWRALILLVASETIPERFPRSGANWWPLCTHAREGEPETPANDA